MAKFKNQSGIPQLIRLPSIHFIKNENGIFWNDAAPKKILEPDEIVETSNENDVNYLRGLSAARKVRNRSGATETKPGFFVEIEV